MKNNFLSYFKAHYTDRLARHFSRYARKHMEVVFRTTKHDLTEMAIFEVGQVEPCKAWVGSPSEDAIEFAIGFKVVVTYSTHKMHHAGHVNTSTIWNLVFLTAIVTTSGFEDMRFVKYDSYHDDVKFRDPLTSDLVPMFGSTCYESVGTRIVQEYFGDLTDQSYQLDTLPSRMGASVVSARLSEQGDIFARIIFEEKEIRLISQCYC